jgi:hypothetical protein
VAKKPAVTGHMESHVHATQVINWIWLDLNTELQSFCINVCDVREKDLTVVMITGTGRNIWYLLFLQ